VRQIVLATAIHVSRSIYPTFSQNATRTLHAITPVNKGCHQPFHKLTAVITTTRLSFSISLRGLLLMTAFVVAKAFHRISTAPIALSGFIIA
jgi:hypothetical protein